MEHILKVDQINPFLQATRETFKTMLKCEVKAGKPKLKFTPDMEYHISGIIGLSGGLLGMVALCFSEDVALKSISAFIQEELTEFDEVVFDGVGELINIIAGYAKKFMTGFSIDISLPMEITGLNHLLRVPKDALTFVVPFESTLGKFYLFVSLKAP